MSQRIRMFVYDWKQLQQMNIWLFPRMDLSSKAWDLSSGESIRFHCDLWSTHLTHWCGARFPNVRPTIISADFGMRLLNLISGTLAISAQTRLSVPGGCEQLHLPRWPGDSGPGSVWGSPLSSGVDGSLERAPWGWWLDVNIRCLNFHPFSKI